MVPVVKQIEMFVGQFGPIKADTTSKVKRYVYVLRKTTEPIPVMDTDFESAEEMNDYCIAGTCSKRVLNSMLQTVDKAMIPMVENQFREPVMIQAAEIDLDAIFDFNKSSVSLATSQLAFSRPSDFRRLSLIIQKEELQQDQGKVGILKKKMSEEIDKKSKLVISIESIVGSKPLEPETIKNLPTKNNLIKDVNNLQTSVQW